VCYDGNKHKIKKNGKLKIYHVKKGKHLKEIRFFKRKKKKEIKIRKGKLQKKKTPRKSAQDKSPAGALPLGRARTPGLGHRLPPHARPTSVHPSPRPPPALSLCATAGATDADADDLRQVPRPSSSLVSSPATSTHQVFLPFSSLRAAV
jgi:hypothetical protein